jgi:hypothetical protein
MELRPSGRRRRVGAGQDEDNDGRSGHQPADDPRRRRRPGPAAPRMPPPALPPARPRLTRGRIRRNRRRHSRTRRHRRHSRNSTHIRSPPRTRNQSPQLRQQPPRRRPAIRLLVQAAVHQEPQFTRQPAHVSGVVDQPVHEQGARPGPERPLSASRVHQHRTQAEDVARRPRVLPQGLLRRREPRRPEPRRPEPRAPRKPSPRKPTPGKGAPGKPSPGEPEPRHPQPVRAQQDVRRVEIPVRQPRVVNRPQPLRQPGRQRQQEVRRHRSPVAHRLGQRRPGHVRRGQPRDVSVQVRGDHRHGERLVHPAGRGDLGPEHRIRGYLSPDDPDRDAVPVRRRAQEQPAAAERLEQLVRPNRRKRNYHRKSPLSVADTAIPPCRDPKPRRPAQLRPPTPAQP